MIGLSSHNGSDATVVANYRYVRDFGEVDICAGVGSTPVSSIQGGVFVQPYMWKGARLSIAAHDMIQP